MTAEAGEDDSGAPYRDEEGLAPDVGAAGDREVTDSSAWRSFRPFGPSSPLETGSVGDSIDSEKLDYLERALGESPVPNVAALLDEPEVVSDFRSGLPRLQRVLTAPEVVCELVRFATTEVPSGTDAGASDWDRRRPFVAVELLACDRLIDAIVHPADSGAEAPLSLLWDFLESSPLGTAAPVFAGYFCAVAAAVFLKSPERTAEEFLRRGPTVVLQQLLGRLELRCCAELLALLVCTDGAQQKALPAETLIVPLLDIIEGGASRIAREHAAFLLDALFGRAVMTELKDDPCAGHLLDSFESSRLVPRLVAVVAKGGADYDSVVAAAVATSALASAVEQLHQLPNHPLLPARISEHRMCLDLSTTCDMGMGVTGQLDPVIRSPVLGQVGDGVVLELCAHLETFLALLPGLPPPSPPEEARISALDESVRLLMRTADAADGSSEFVVDTGDMGLRLAELAARDAIVREALERRGWSADGDEPPPAPPVDAELVAELRGEAQRRRADLRGVFDSAGFGAIAALEVAKLLVHLGRVRRGPAPQALQEAGAAPRCLAALLASRWSSMLHNALRGAFSEMVSDQDAEGRAAAMALLEDHRDVVHRAVQEHRMAAVLHNDADGGARCAVGVGFLGPLHHLCAQLYELGVRMPEVQGLLNDIEGWTDAIVPELQAIDRLTGEPLGGPMPEPDESSPVGEFDFLAAIRAEAQNSSGEADLTVEDMLDIDENLLEVHTLIELSDLRARRRQLFGGANKSLGSPTSGDEGESGGESGGDGAGDLAVVGGDLSGAEEGCDVASEATTAGTAEGVDSRFGEVPPCVEEADTGEACASEEVEGAGTAGGDEDGGPCEDGPPDGESHEAEDAAADEAAGPPAEPPEIAVEV